MRKNLPFQLGRFFLSWYCFVISFEICTALRDTWVIVVKEKRRKSYENCQKEVWKMEKKSNFLFLPDVLLTPFPLLHFLWELIPGGHIFAHNDVDDDSTSICVSFSLFLNLSFPFTSKWKTKNISVMTRLMNREVILLTKPRAYIIHDVLHKSKTTIIS